MERKRKIIEYIETKHAGTLIKSGVPMRDALFSTMTEPLNTLYRDNGWYFVRCADSTEELVKEKGLKFLTHNNIPNVMKAFQWGKMLSWDT
ncbi:hypothetical protein CW713_01150 [Methanophagales archaeon]|nr:MAG: hypothetical protein CW714_03565 [Methanophagales archaeon]RJS85762.1 MAG: hypothetical protein CW713_01150 [Methanophagales archaeon]